MIMLSPEAKHLGQPIETAEILPASGLQMTMVERTLAWRNRTRRLTVRDERRADLHQALPTLHHQSCKTL
jgi:hypothetical protein